MAEHDAGRSARARSGLGTGTGCAGAGPGELFVSRDGIDVQLDWTGCLPAESRVTESGV
jgi:hypothetical protein